MAAIVTITFSPCIDKTTTVNELVPEKKLVCSAPKLEPGGGGINIARAIHKLGGNAIAIFPSGGYTGKFFNHLLDQEGVPSIIIETSNETRENIIVLDKASNRQYRFGMPGTFLKEQEWKQCLAAVESLATIDFLIASGSLPPGVPLEIYAMLAQIANNKQAKFIVDSSGEALAQALKAPVYLIKPNLGELAALLGKSKIELDQVATEATILVHEKQCEMVLVSMGAEGAILVTRDAVFKTRAPQIKIQSTVGAGDSMLAGMVWGLSQGLTLPSALRYGVACGTAATMNTGTELCRKADVEYLYQQMQSC